MSNLLNQAAALQLSGLLYVTEPDGCVSVISSADYESLPFEIANTLRLHWSLGAAFMARSEILRAKGEKR